MGFQADKSTLNNQITRLAVAWRDLAEESQHLLTQCLITGNVHNYVVAAGYDNAPNPLNPGGISDATQAEQFIDYMGGTLAGVYFGIATQPAVFNFNSALSPAWNGQL